MKSRHSAPVVHLHELFYALAFVYPAPFAYRVFLWAAEKFLLLSPLILPILADSPWDYINSLLRYFSVLNYFSSSGSGFPEFSLALVCTFHCFVAAVVYRLIKGPDAHPFFGWTVSLGFPCLHSIVLPLTTIIAAYLCCLLFYGQSTAFSTYKQISASLIAYEGTMHMVLCALYVLMLVETATLDLAAAFLTQEDQLVLRCLRPSRLKLLDLFTRIAVPAAYVLDPHDDHLIWAACVLAALFLVKVAVWFLTPLAVRDLPEYACDGCALLLLGFRGMMFELELKDRYQYSLVIPVYVFLSCVIRLLLKSVYFLKEVKSEDDALYYLRTAVELCTKTDKASMMQACGLLEVHRRTCTRVTCGCREVTVRDLVFDWAEPGKLNYKTCETDKELPLRVVTSRKLRVLSIIISDIKPALIKSESVGIGMAEIYYYFLANHYEALMYLQGVEAGSPSLVVDQWITNLRNVIERGMNRESEESVNLMATLKFQLEYYSFLHCIEYSCECTIKFWGLLQGDRPDSIALTGLGQEIFETSQKLLQLVSTINRMNPDHMDFLLKFGLYSKHILHDKTSTEHAFQRILWNAENSSTRHRKDQAMTVMVSLEDQTFCSVLEVNSELEQQLGYKREELIGFPSTKLMHSAIARQHQELVRRFFRSMHSDQIGNEKQHFLRHQEGHVVACRGIKRLIPNLTGGLKGMIVTYPDPVLSLYTVQRSDHTKRRTGALICDAKGRVTEYTKEAEEMGLHKEVLVSGTRLHLVFPQLKDERIAQHLSRPQGGVISFDPANGNEENPLDSGELRVHKAPFMAAAPADENALMWVRLVQEKCGDDILTLALFAPVMKSSVGEYKPMDRFAGRVFERVAPTVSEFAAKQQQILLQQQQARPGFSSAAEATTTNRNGGSSVDVMSDSRASSVGSMASVSQSVNSNNDAILNDEMQQQANGAGSTPTIIKRLILALVTFFVVVITLVAVETQQFFKESGELRDRFQMIEYFTIRYQLLIYLADCPRSYDLYRRGTDPANFVAFCGRTRTRTSKAAYYNLMLQKSYAKFGLDYDYQTITIQAGTDFYPASLNYALLNYINRAMVFATQTDYNLARSCINDTTSTVCVDTTAALNYCLDNGGYTLLPLQRTIAQSLISDLMLIANKGRNALYILISVCIAVVLFSSVLILVLLIWVIKDKSNVMAIFAEVQPEEIDSILGQARSLNISTARFDQKQLNDVGNDEEAFWKSFCRRRRAKGSPNGSPNPAGGAETPITPNVLLPGGMAAAEGQKSPILVPQSEQKCAAENGEEEGLEKSVDADADMVKLRLEEEELKKRETKRQLLSQIDSGLRNKSVAKLGVVLMFFMVYGGGSLYFNYYVHEFNDEVTNFFYYLTKRDTYATLICMYFRESVRLRRKDFLQYSNNSDDMFMMDYVDETLRVEERVNEYNTREANKKIFANYLDLNAKLNSPQFCAYVDSYQVGQSGYCNTSYMGPQAQGLAAGIAFYVAYQVTYATGKIQPANFSDDKAITAISTDPGFSMAGAKVDIYLQSGIEQLLIQYRKDAVAYYGVIESILIAKAAGFIVLFIAIYILVFVGLLGVLTREIWLTKGMLNMIPKFVVEHNMTVQTLIYERRRAIIT